MCRGGFTEASALPRLVSPFYPDTKTAGDPASAWADAIAKNCRSEKNGRARHRSGYMEDHQVMLYLANELRQRSIDSQLITPAGSMWNDKNISAIVRFYQAEWLAHLPKRTGWKNFFRESAIPILNPTSSTLVESKRFPLVWDQLKTNLRTWRDLLPTTVDPRTVNWQNDPRWLLKTAFCNTGDSVSAPDLLTKQQWRKTKWDVRLHPNSWIAQQRFQTVRIASPIGPVTPCIGVYTIDGEAIGIYSRLSKTDIINFTAIDVATLIQSDQIGEMHQ